MESPIPGTARELCRQSPDIVAVCWRCDSLFCDRSLVKTGTFSHTTHIGIAWPQLGLPIIGEYGLQRFKEGSPPILSDWNSNLGV